MYVLGGIVEKRGRPIFNTAVLFDRPLGRGDHLGVEVFRGHGLRGQNGDVVVEDLGEAAVDEHPPGLPAMRVAALADAQLAQQWRPAAEDAQLAVVHGDDDLVSGGLEHLALGRDHDQLD